MPKICQICGRGTAVANNVSHSNRKTRRTQEVNLQHKKIDGTKMRVCTSCIKTNNKNKVK
ncbi:MAG: 50S ribosomal protein L28 [bacterium]